MAAFQAGARTPERAARKASNRPPGRCARNTSPEIISPRWAWEPSAAGCSPPDDDTAGAAPVAVLSHRAWQTAYGSDPSVVGSTFIVEGHPFTVIGVAPPGFFGETLRSDPPDIWIPRAPGTHD